MKTMNRTLYKTIAVLFILMMCVSFAGCGNQGNSVYNVEGTYENRDIKKGKYKITDISVVSAVENDDNIWMINWPKCYYVDNYYVDFFSCEEMSEEQRNFIYSFVNSLPKYQGDEEYLYLIRMNISSGKDYKNHDIGAQRCICGSYPEEFEEFVNIINDICGGDKEYINSNTKVVEITPELFTARTNVADINVYGGTVPELMSFLNIDDIYSLNSFGSGRGLVVDSARNFSAVKYLVNEVKSTPSTDEECYDYAVKLAKKLDIDDKLVVKEISEYGEQEWYSVPGYKDYNLRVYRADLIEDKIAQTGGYVDSYYDTFRIYEDMTSPGDELQGYALYDFTYSPDYKFAIAVLGDIDKDKKIFAELGGVIAKLGTAEEAVDTSDTEIEE